MLKGARMPLHEVIDWQGNSWHVGDRCKIHSDGYLTGWAATVLGCAGTVIELVTANIIKVHWTTQGGNEIDVFIETNRVYGPQTPLSLDKL